MTRLPDREPLDVRMSKAMSHPVRIRLLAALQDGESSPSQLARRLELPLVNVSHHMRVMAKLGVVEQVAQRFVGGAIEHRYRLTRLPWSMPEDLGEMPIVGIRSQVATIASLAFDDLRTALGRDRTFERSNLHATFTPLELDEEGWTRVYALLLETLETALEEEAAARERLARDGVRPTRGRLTMMFYDAPEDEGPAEP